MTVSFPKAIFTAAVQRILIQCQRVIRPDSSCDEVGSLLLVLLLQDESLASACLRRKGISVQELSGWGLCSTLVPAPAVEDVTKSPDDYPVNPSVFSDTGNNTPDSAALTEFIHRSTLYSRRLRSDNGITTTHLLLAVLDLSSHVVECLERGSVSAEEIHAELDLTDIDLQPRLPVDFQLAFSSENNLRLKQPESDHWFRTASDPRTIPPDNAASDLLPDLSQSDSSGYSLDRTADSDLRSVLRLMEASLNRTREGLRVLEDYARFVRNDPAASRRLKETRHSLSCAEHLLQTAVSRRLPGESQLLACRDTAGDVGTDITMDTESTRASVQGVVIANFRRIQEALRSLEEFGKLVAVDFSAAMKQLRYLVYEIEKQLHATAAHLTRPCPTSADRSRTQQLQQSALCVLISEEAGLIPWKALAHELLETGPVILQLREKHLSDKELLRRATWLADACRQSGALCIINDRTDVAKLSGADGVHLGQDDMEIAEARRLLDRGQLIGRSTHNLEQARTAVSQGADYLGVGPMFPSQTKSFDFFPGTTFAQQVASEVQIPWFAIGGITLQTTRLLAASGVTRIAVGSAVSSSQTPGIAAKELISAMAVNVGNIRSQEASEPAQ
jgi:thiamine-phosphate pyrophosphorylase